VTAVEVEVAPENHTRFLRLMQQVRPVFMRKGAINARLDQGMQNPNRFRMQAMHASWAAYRRLEERITEDECTLWLDLWALTVSKEPVRGKRYLNIQHWMPAESHIPRLRRADYSEAREA
jgi:hypothetical protein